MDREDKSQRAGRPAEREFVLQWGKRLRCVRGKNPNSSSKSAGGIRRRNSSPFVSGAGSELDRHQLNGFARLSETSNFGSPLVGGRKSVSPDKEERYYTTRGSLVGGGGGMDENRKLVIGGGGEEKGGGENGGVEFVWPKLVSPGAWLSDLCQERYEVRERKTSKKKSKGLKSMGAVESDSE